jgi:uncharacterized membrane protein
MPPGAYQGSVLLKVAGQSDTTMVINMQINSQAPTLSVSSPTPTITWTIGDPIPTATIKLVSTGGAIPYSITSSGVLSPAITDTVKSGLAYSFGTQIPVTFDQTAFASAQANSQLNGLVSVAWGTNPTITSVVAFVVNVQSPLATLNSIYPASIAAATAPTTCTLTLTGAGFIVSPDSSIVHMSGFRQTACIARTATSRFV